MKKIITYFLLITSSFAFCQRHTSQLEKQIINEFKQDSINYDFIASLSAIDTLVTRKKVEEYKKTINNLIGTLPKKESKAKREVKRIKKIYDLVHDTLFSKYEELAYFPQIFDNKIYNCVTATAVYAYIFDTLKIPYTIKDVPGHVFLIAYPKTHKIHLETTAPGIYGFSSPKDSEVNDIVNNLIKLKLITKKEVDSVGIGKTYMNYFYGNTFLNKSALIGMQYYNRGLDKYSKEDYANAQDDITKSLIFFNYAPSEFLNKNLVFLNLGENELTTESDIDKLFEAFSTMKFKEDFNEKDLKVYLYKIIDNDENDLKFIEKAASILSKFENKKLNYSNKIFLYEYLLSKNAKDDELNETIRLADTLLMMSSKNKIAKEGVNYAVLKKLALLPFSSDALDEVNKYTTKYPFLLDNKKIDSYKAYIYGRLIDENYRALNISIGKKYFDKFDKNIINGKNKGKLHINPEIVANVYATVGKYYYRNNKFKIAYEVLNKGLVIYPNHKEIKKFLKWTNDEMN